MARTQKQSTRRAGTRGRFYVAGRIWYWFMTSFTVLGLIYLALALSPVPFIEHNSATVMNPSRGSLRATAKAIAAGIGKPIAELHTGTVTRFLYQDGTSVDFATNAEELGMMYNVAALKSIVLGHLSLETPSEVAGRIRDVLQDEGFRTQVIYQPDPAFKSGDVIIILSDAFKVTEDAGFGIIVRRTALRIDGPIPDLFDDTY